MSEKFRLLISAIIFCRVLSSEGTFGGTDDVIIIDKQRKSIVKLEFSLSSSSFILLHSHDLGEFLQFAGSRSPKKVNFL